MGLQTSMRDRDRPGTTTCALCAGPISPSSRRQRPHVQEDARSLFSRPGSGNGTFLNGLSIDVKLLSPGDRDHDR